MPNIERRHQFPLSSGDLHAVIDQACHYGVDIPDCGVMVLHPLLVPSMNFLYFKKDPSLDVLWNSVKSRVSNPESGKRRPVELGLRSPKKTSTGSSLNRSLSSFGMKASG